MIAWICKNQLGRRNLTPEQKKYLIGKQYEAEKSSHGGERGLSRNEKGHFTASGQNVHLRSKSKTSERIATENGVNEKYVRRAERYAKGIDIADEVAPGIRQEILNGSLKPTDADVSAVLKAEPEDRPALVEKLREQPPRKDKDQPKKRKVPKPDEPDIKLIQKIADDMLLDRGNGNPDTMIYEMNDALESMMFRWNFCQTNYAAFFELEKCRTEIKKLIRTGYDFLAQYEGGLTQYDDT